VLLLSAIGTFRAVTHHDNLDMPVLRQTVKPDRFNPDLAYPYELRPDDLRAAMQDVYDFLFDVNTMLVGRGLKRFDDMMRPAALSGMLSDMLTASLAQHSRVLTENGFHNGHPDLIVQGQYANNAVKSGSKGVEVKATRKWGGAVDTHGAREQWMCVFVYRVDSKTQPAVDRAALRFTEVYLGHVTTEDFRRNDWGELGTRTATLDRDGIAKLRASWAYLDR
jgi:hypothetical protein